MNVISKVFKLDEQQYYESHVTIVNSVFPVRLTQMEIRVVSSFLRYSYKYPDFNVFSTQVRQRVMEDLNLSKGGMSNYIRALTKKGYIIVNSENNMELIPLLRVDSSQQAYQFMIVNNQG